MKANTLYKRRRIPEIAERNADDTFSPDDTFSDVWISGDATDPIVGKWLPMGHMDVASAQLLSGSTRTIAPIIESVDEVNGDEEFHFVNGRFTLQDIGATLEISGSASNDGSFLIEDVVGPGDIVTDGASVAEEFADDVIVTVTRPARAGSWKVEVSDIWDPETMSGQDLPFNFPPSDLTAEFSPTINPVVVATVATHNQPVNAALFGFLALRWAFTPTSTPGLPGVISLAVNAKGGR